MRIGRALAVLAGMIFGSMFWAIGAAAAEETDRPAELKALDRWVGEWEMEVSVKPAAWLPQGSRSTFKASPRWTLNGRVLQCDANGEGAAGERPPRARLERAPAPLRQPRRRLHAHLH